VKSVGKRASRKIRMIIIATEGKQGKSARKQGEIWREAR
jgi:hypothetical protein